MTSLKIGDTFTTPNGTRYTIEKIGRLHVSVEIKKPGERMRWETLQFAEWRKIAPDPEESP